MICVIKEYHLFNFFVVDILFILFALQSHLLRVRSPTKSEWRTQCNRGYVANEIVCKPRIHLHFFLLFFKTNHRNALSNKSVTVDASTTVCRWVYVVYFFNSHLFLQIWTMQAASRSASNTADRIIERQPSPFVMQFLANLVWSWFRVWIFVGVFNFLNIL